MRVDTWALSFLVAIFINASSGAGSQQPLPSIFESKLTSGTHTVAINISKLTRVQIEKLKSDSRITWWGEFGDALVVGGGQKGLNDMLRDSTFQILAQWADLQTERLEVAIAAHTHEIPSGRQLVVKSGRLSLLARSVTSSDAKPKPDWRFKITPFTPNTIYVRAGHVETQPKIWSKAQYDRAKNIMAEVDPVRWYLDVGTLTNWNRHVSSVDVVSARDWIKSELDELRPSSSNIQKFNVMGRDAWNVIAKFEGQPGSDIYIICGHYDAISERPSESAPGAEDNATGAAGVLELARVFARVQKSATLMFVTFSGEEQGLVGSKAFVKSLDSATRARIKAVLNMDMIGYSKDDSEDVLLESSSRYKSLVDQFAAAASLISGLKYYVTFNPYGSDHMPFLDAGIPAILTIDNDWGDYPHYHRSSDTIDKVSRDMGAAILRMNAGALAAMLN